MKRMLINATQQEELRVALVDGQRLYDLDIEHFGHEQKKSCIYKGKITRIEPSLEAVFIDYGSKKHGFLPFKEVSKDYFLSNTSFSANSHIKDLLREGQEIIVQITKEERGNKGAALTTFISLAGSYLVLMPNNPNITGISRRIEGSNRIEMKKLISLLNLPKNMGLIIRTAGLGKSLELLQWDLSIRMKHWDAIIKSSKNKSAPFLIHQESNIMVRAFRDHLCQEIGEIVIDNPNVVDVARQHISFLGRPDFKNKIKLYTGDVPLFSYYQIESQISSAFQREVRLSSGGSIVIDTTEALTAIDINSSRSTKGTDIEETAFHTNIEAVEEIVRQLRLRDLGGLIVIDFIDMLVLKNQKKIENKLRELASHDRARIQIGSISKFGLLEMSRQRISSSLKESTHHICPRCTGTGTIRDNESLSLSILRIIEEESLKENTCEIHAIVPIEIACYLLNEKRAAVNSIEKRQFSGKIIIIPNNKMKTPNYSVLRIRKGEKIKSTSYHLPNFHRINFLNALQIKNVEKKQNEFSNFRKSILVNNELKKNSFNFYKKNTKEMNSKNKVKKDLVSYIGYSVFSTTNIINRSQKCVLRKNNFKTEIVKKVIPIYSNQNKKSKFNLKKSFFSNKEKLVKVNKYFGNENFFLFITKELVNLKNKIYKNCKNDFFLKKNNKNIFKKIEKNFLFGINTKKKSLFYKNSFFLKKCSELFFLIKKNIDAVKRYKLQNVSEYQIFRKIFFSFQLYNIFYDSYFFYYNFPIWVLNKFFIFLENNNKEKKNKNFLIQYFYVKKIFFKKNVFLKKIKGKTFISFFSENNILLKVHNIFLKDKNKKIIEINLSFLNIKSIYFYKIFIKKYIKYIKRTVKCSHKKNFFYKKDQVVDLISVKKNKKISVLKKNFSSKYKNIFLQKNYSNSPVTKASFSFKDSNLFSSKTNQNIRKKNQKKTAAGVHMAKNISNSPMCKPENINIK
ncbi:ribonuclease E [Buchnera aphidicola (Mindarus keteleerifoliae)]|uniref:ribonuclease E n=1 Tax=Buchnera aphidicola TaxID=9 RepID=UPI0031B71942